MDNDPWFDVKYYRTLEEAFGPSASLWVPHPYNPDKALYVGATLLFIATITIFLWPK